MKSLLRFMLACLLLLPCADLGAQVRSIIEARKGTRLQLLWKYCSDNMISDKDSVAVHGFLNDIIRSSDSINDPQLKLYAVYFRKCWRILFSGRYEDHFAPGDYHSPIEILKETQSWALLQGSHDIAASCEHYIGEIHFRANHYGQAFEHLLNANAAFDSIGYQNVPNISDYLYHLGLHFYQFKEFDKALEFFLHATRHTFYLPRVELNTLNAIGLIYCKKNEEGKAVKYFRNTILKARLYNDPAWVGIGAGNLGNVFLSAHDDDSALYYHRKNIDINAGGFAYAPEDAAKSALSIATVFLRKDNLDSVTYYTHTGRKLASLYIKDSTESLEFRRRLLKVMVGYLKVKKDFRGALELTDSLAMTEHELRTRLDSKILNRAIERSEAALFDSRLTLLRSQKEFVQFRLYVIIISLVLLIALSGFIFREKWLGRKRQIQLAEKDKQILLIEKLRVEEGLKYAEEMLRSYIDMIKEKTKIIEQLEMELMILKKPVVEDADLHAISLDRERLKVSTILTDNEWLQFRALFEQVYPGFSERMKEHYPGLSPAESRFLYLAKLNLSTREMAAMLGISVYAIHKLRYRLRKKLGMEENMSFQDVILKIK